MSCPVCGSEKIKGENTEPAAEDYDRCEDVSYFGLRENGHCGNCACMTCRDEYGAMPVQEKPSGVDDDE